MNTPLPIREARRIFVIILGCRLVLTSLAITLLTPLAITLPRLRGAGFLPYLMAAAILPALLEMLLASPLLDRPLRHHNLALALLLDVTLGSVRSAAAAPLVERATQRWQVLSGLALPQHEVLVEPFLFLLLPLVLMAWAYGRRGALYGWAWAALLHVGVGALSPNPDVPPIARLFSALVRVAMLCGVPLLVSILAKRERQTMTELEQAHRRLQRHAATVEQLAISRERNRMARDLHDTLAHTLAALTVHLGALLSLLRHDPQAAEEAAEQALEMARKGLEESRRAIQAQRDDPVVTLGLAGAMRAALLSFQTRSGTQARLTVAGDEVETTDDEASTLYRILEEALANIERHAQAEHVAVRLASTDGEVTLQVSDDGVGFDPAGVDEAGYGLLGMRERAEMVGARLEVSSRPGHGSEVWCALPR
jgi:signal transduction histidine kinase